MGIHAMKLFPWQVTLEQIEYANARNIGCLYDRTFYFWGKFPEAPRHDLQSLLIWYVDMKEKR